MPALELSFKESRAVDRLMRFLAVEGVTGQEKAIANEVALALLEAGVSRTNIFYDKANERIPVPTQTGNLIVKLSGTLPGPRRLFMTHLDTVPLCAGVVPVRKGNRIVPRGKTALGGDNRTGCACLVTMLATMIERNLPHPPMTVLFTVREESGLWGARFVDVDELGNPELGFNVDGRAPDEITIGAVGAERWEVEIWGKASHAGVHPERGISATLVAAHALADVHRKGYFGKVKKPGKTGTSNVGPFGGVNGRCAGDATNVVTDYVHIRGEARSHDAKFAHEITLAYRDAFARARTMVKDDRGKQARVRFCWQKDYYPFHLKASSPVIELAQQAARHAGWQGTMRTSNGGLDANWTTRHGVPTITFGGGQNNIHTVDEYVDIPQFLQSCRYALALATTV